MLYVDQRLVAGTTSDEEGRKRRQNHLPADERERDLPGVHDVVQELLEHEAVAELRRAVPEELHEEALADDHEHVVADAAQRGLELEPEVMRAVEQLAVRGLRDAASARPRVRRPGWICGASLTVPSTRHCRFEERV